MFCPRCATENVNEASFCRACGADIHLVSQALTGRLTTVAPTGDDQIAKRKDKELAPARLDKIFENIFLGLAFLMIFLGGLFFFTRGFVMWVWFIIPSFTCIGRGIGLYLRYRQEQQQGRSLPPAPTLAPESLRPAQTNASLLSARDTSEILPHQIPPPSVTEGTTRHLDAGRAPLPSSYTPGERAE